jgi:hypothetical protein
MVSAGAAGRWIKRLWRHFSKSRSIEHRLKRQKVLSVVLTSRIWKTQGTLKKGSRNSYLIPFAEMAIELYKK